MYTHMRENGYENECACSEDESYKGGGLREHRAHTMQIFPSEREP